MPGKWIPAPWTRYPVTASMATRECLSSAAWNHARVSSDPAVARLNGSNGPTGLVDPGRSARFAFSARLTLFSGAGAKAEAAPIRVTMAKIGLMV